MAKPSAHTQENLLALTRRIIRLALSSLGKIDSNNIGLGAVMNSIEKVLSLSHEAELAILSHGFSDYIRDYEILVAEYHGVEWCANRVFQFIGCVSATVRTEIDSGVYARSIHGRTVSDEGSIVAGPDLEIVFGGVFAFLPHIPASISLTMRRWLDGRRVSEFVCIRLQS